METVLRIRGLAGRLLEPWEETWGDESLEPGWLEKTGTGKGPTVGKKKWARSTGQAPRANNISDRLSRLDGLTNLKEKVIGRGQNHAVDQKDEFHLWTGVED